ncbi:MAG: SCO family protein [Acidobacteriia bacterium]|nr:SCO family protein [Terriglobia bacterium]
MGIGRQALRIGIPILTLGLAACGGRPALPVIGEVPEFQLTSQTGATVGRNALLGHVWVADFIFTTCPGPCPRMSSDMHQIQTATATTPDVKLVSFTVDPSHDTPAVLAAYGKHFLADSSRWYFLTGAQTSLDQVGRAGFKLNPVDGSLEHSTRFALVDRQARIRGYYASSDDDFPSSLLRDLRQLVHSANSPSL